jgi:hypothetical protein
LTLAPLLDAPRPIALHTDKAAEIFLISRARETEKIKANNVKPADRYVLGFAT